MPASGVEAAGPLSRLFHHEGKARQPATAVCSYYGYYHDGSGQIRYGLLTRMSNGTTVVAQAQAPALAAPGSSDTDQELAELRLLIDQLRGNLAVVNGTAIDARKIATDAGTTATTAGTTATTADTKATVAGTTATAADTKAGEVKTELEKKLGELEEQIKKKADK